MNYSVIKSASAVLAVYFAASVALSFAEDIIEVEPIEGGLTGNATASRYWDCCKPSCAWRSVAGIDPPVDSCEADGVTRANIFSTSGCEENGTAFACTDQHSWVVNETFALGYVGAVFEDEASLNGSMCCSCFLLGYTGGKQLLVQVINGLGGTPNGTVFDIAIPGGGVGGNTAGCTRQWGAPEGGWGEQFGGVETEDDCSDLPEELEEFCHFRFDFLEGLPNVDISYTQVKCPTQLTNQTNCLRDE